MYLGIEIGGTKLQLGLGLGDGTPPPLWRGQVERGRGADGIRQQIIQAVPQLLMQGGNRRGAFQGIGIGFGGPVDDIRHTVIKSHQIEGWTTFPSRIGSAAWSRPCLAFWTQEVPNFRRCSATTPMWRGWRTPFGAGKGFSPVFYITIGSGIGGGLIVDGKIQRGCGKGAAEIGHLRWPRTSPSGLKRTIVEETASGWGLETEAHRLGPMRGHEASAALREMIAGDWQKITARHLALAAEADDPFAWAVLRPAWETLAEAICQVIALVCPAPASSSEAACPSWAKRCFSNRSGELVAKARLRPFAGCYDIVPAAVPARKSSST